MEGQKDVYGKTHGRTHKRTAATPKVSTTVGRETKNGQNTDLTTKMYSSGTPKNPEKGHE